MAKKFTQSLLRMPTAQSPLQLKFSSSVNPIIVMPCVCGQKIYSVFVLCHIYCVLVMNTMPANNQLWVQRGVGLKLWKLQV